MSRDDATLALPGFKPGPADERSEEAHSSSSTGYISLRSSHENRGNGNGAGGGVGGVKPLRILVAFECSGAIRRELRALGHDAWSCDLNPARDGSEYHLQGDVHEIIDQPLRMLRHSFEAMLAVGPTCRYLTNSAEWAYKDPDFARYPGVGYHMRLKPGTLFGAERRAAREAQIERVKELWNCGIEQIAIENPVGVLSTRFLRPAPPHGQVIQPHWFGEDASKATCLWLKNLPPLVPTQRVAPRMVNGKPRWGNQTDGGQNKLSPSDDREELRSMTYPGVAAAMATQWFGGRRGLGCGDTPSAAEEKYNAEICGEGAAPSNTPTK